ncbi:MAG: hypothetical protein J6Y72_07165, partial [Bacteroidales bacterium]|nr:hypothetical protein [Bacteroidales bacterium]
MIRKLLTTHVPKALCLLVMLSGIATGAWAQTDAVASVSDGTTTTPYSEFSEALTAWVDGSTLTLLKDVETASTITVPSGTYTLDLNGCGLRAIGTGYSIITVSFGASLTLADSRPTATTHYFSVESPTSNGAGLATDISDIDNGNQLSFQGGYITGANNSGPGGAIVVAEYGYLSINGGTLIGNLTNEQGAGLYVYHNQSKDPTVRLTMTGGAVIYNKTTGNKGWGGGINVGGKIVMSGGIVAHNVSSMDKGGIHCHYIDMSGGSIVENFAENSFSGGVHADCGVTLSGSPVITGNTANGVVRNLDWDVYNEFPTLSVTGELTCPDNSIGITMATPGVFTNSENTALNDASRFVSDNENYIVRKTAEGQLELYAQPVASVTAEGTTTEYTSLAEALEAWVDGSTLKLIRDVKPTSTITVPSGTLTLDLNGHGI